MQPQLKAIATVSLVVGTVVYSLLLLFNASSFANGVQFPPWLVLWVRFGLASVAVGLFWVAFDRWLWKWPFVRDWDWLVPVPYVAGRYVGTLRRKDDEPHDFVIEISQRYLSVKLQTFSAKSRGESLAVSFRRDPTSGSAEMWAIWKCRTVRRDGSDLKEDFLGASVYHFSRIENGKWILSDDYFTGRNPPTRGEMSATWVGRKRYNCFDPKGSD